MNTRRPFTDASVAGREAETWRLDRFLEAAGPSESSHVLLVTGEAGIGKTGMLEAAISRARAHGAAVLRAEGVESEIDLGFATLSQLLAPAQALHSCLPRTERQALNAALAVEAEQVATQDELLRATQRLLETLARSVPDTNAMDKGRATTLLVAVDDMQWIDRASADVLGRLTRTLRGDGIRMLVSQRSGSRSFFDAADHPRLELGPIGDGAADQILRERFPQATASARSRVIDEAAGNPLALLELASALVQGEPIDVMSMPTHLPLTQRLRGLYGSRFLSLPAETRQLLLVAALDVAQQPLTLPDRSELLRVLEPALAADLVHLDSRGDQARLRHPLVRTTVVAMSSTQERRQAHATLASRYVPGDDRAAFHMAAAAAWPDEEVAQMLERAAHRAVRRGDPTGAVRTFIRAAEMSPDPAQRARRYAQAAYRGADVDRGIRVATVLLGNARHADPRSVETVEAAVATAYVLLTGTGDTHTAHQVLKAALEGATAHGDADVAVIADAVHTLCQVCLYAADPNLWPAFETAVARVPLDRFPALALWSQVMVDPARSARPALAFLERQLRQLEHECDPVLIERVATAGVFVDRVGMARQPLERLVARGRRGETVTGAITALMLLSLDDFNTGHWARAESQVAEGLVMTDQHDMALLEWPLKLTRSLLDAARGEHHRVVTLTDQMLNWSVPRRVGTVQHYAAHASCLDALGRGDYEAAYRAACSITPSGKLAPNIGHALWISMDLVEAAVHAGHRQAAAAHVRALKQAEIADLSPRLAFLVAGAEAIAAVGADRRLFDRAIAMGEGGQWPFDLARVRLCYGQRLRRTRASSEARTHLLAAENTFADLDCGHWAARAHSEYLATSLVKQSGHQLQTGLLTAQERRVAVLAAEGLSNKRIAEQLLISSRTVGAHLHQVYLKLSLNGRAGLHLALIDMDRDGHTHSKDKDRGT